MTESNSELSSNVQHSMPSATQPVRTGSPKLQKGRAHATSSSQLLHAWSTGTLSTKQQQQASGTMTQSPASKSRLQKSSSSSTTTSASAPNFDRIYKLIKLQLYAKLDKRLYYHGAHHTFRDVLPAAIELCKWERLNEEDTLIVKTAALFHDTGFLDQYDKNEPFGCKRARETLPYCGYSPEQISRIEECIMATQMPQNPKNLLSQIVCDADLAYLGTHNVFLNSEGLRLELNAMKNLGISPREWNKNSMEFMKNHSYWTRSAQERLKPVKEKHIQQMAQLLNL